MASAQNPATQSFLTSQKAELSKIGGSAITSMGEMFSEFASGVCSGPLQSKFTSALSEIERFRNGRNKLVEEQRRSVEMADPHAIAITQIANAGIAAADTITVSVLVEAGDFALRSKCLDEANTFYRGTLAFSGATLEGYLRRAQIGIDDVRALRR
jgi:hypothetical protein